MAGAEPLHSEMSEYESFLKKVDEVSSIISGLNSKDPRDVEKAKQQADNYIKWKDNSVTEEDGCRITSSPTVINQKALENETTGPDGAVTMSPESFMSQVTKDAEDRAEKMKENKAESEQYKKKGNDAFRSGRFDEALAFYTKAINKNSDSCVLYTNRAQTYLKLGKYRSAIEDCHWALKVNEKSLKALIHKGKAHQALGQFNIALECLDMADKYHSTHSKLIQEYRDAVQQAMVMSQQKQ